MMNVLNQIILIAHHRVALLDKVIPAPGVVVAQPHLGLLLLLDRFPLQPYKLCMRCDVRQTHPLEVSERGKAVPAHKLGELRAALAHHAIPVHHHPAADLNGIRPEKDEFGRVIARVDPADAAQALPLARVLVPNEARDGRHACQRDGLDRRGGVSAVCRHTLDTRLRTKGVQIDRADALDRVDGGNAIAPCLQAHSTWHRDVRNIGRHLAPHRDTRMIAHPLCHLRQQLAVLTHGHAHLAFRHPVRAGKVDLKPVDAGLLAHVHELNPRLLVVLLHDGRDQNVIRVLPLEPDKILKHRLERPVGNQLDVLPPDHLAGV
mmetsp:Transcript_15743/g.44976  ORF Transcript_15743/g.44976 Transcript_15743/m.44976 type:complete len:319 (-) Transcript_15743:269-1225(-)